VRMPAQQAEKGFHNYLPLMCKNYFSETRLFISNPHTG
jgi:hypothetical protein